MIPMIDLLTSSEEEAGTAAAGAAMAGIAAEIADIAERHTGSREWEPATPPAVPAAQQPCGSGDALLEQRDRLFSEFRPLVQRLIRKYGDSAEQRQDLEGEIYCLFSDLVEAFDPRRGVPLRAYLVHQLNASVYTLARRRWRHERREVCMEIREDAARTDDDPSRAWDAEIMMEQAREALPEAIAKLPRRQRQVLIWRYYEHRSFEEIAEALDVQVATTRSLLRHALNGLRKSFAQASVCLDGFEG
jgi:RNA polymerase sigma factor (sigma-70 family)